MGRKRKSDPKKSRKWDRYYDQPVISEKYPNVKSLTIKMTYYDDSGNRQVGETQTWNVPLTTAIATFYEDCPMWECVDGGFDLTPSVDSLIRKGESHAHGKLICQGWQDEERVGHFHCLTEMHYEVLVEYK
jgi:hypothetical protein